MDRKVIDLDFAQGLNVEIPFVCGCDEIRMLKITNPCTPNIGGCSCGTSWYVEPKKRLNYYCGCADFSVGYNKAMIEVDYSKVDYLVLNQMLLTK